MSAFRDSLTPVERPRGQTPALPGNGRRPYCANCEELRLHIEYLQSELAPRHSDSDLLLLRKAFRLTLQQATVVAALYRAAGAVLSYQQITDVSAEYGADRRGRGDPDNLPSPSTSNVLICKIRKKLTPTSVDNLPTRGYALSQEGMALVREALL